jgi:peptide/nickel transport system substrate-binding protein
MAIDREELIEALLTSRVTGECYGRDAIGTITPALCDWYNHDVVPLPFDVAASKALFAEAGWRDTDGDGWLDRDGRRFEFKLATNAGNKRREQATVIIQAQLQKVGVKADIDYVETTTFFEQARQRDYEAMLAGWSAALLVDPTNVWHSDAPERRYEFNFVSYSNPEVDRLIDEALEALDPAEAQAKIREMQALIHADQPYTFLYWRDDLVGVHARFRDVKIDILSLLNDLHLWWVPERLQKYRTRAER